MRIVRAADLVRTPWKNGGGETAEIAVHPVGAGFADFGWRLSMATVASDGPFSRFEGVDRTLAVLSGEGLALTVDGVPHRLTPDAPPLAFPGDVPAGAMLVGGVVTDLNVMTRRGSFTQRVERIGPGPIDAPARAATALVATWSGRIGAVDVLVGDTVFLDPGHHLVFTGPSALLVRIEPVGGQP